MATEYKLSYTAREIDSKLGMIDTLNNTKLDTSDLNSAINTALIQALSLGIASDGLIYIFVDGEPVGTGIPQGQSGDVFGYVDENNTIVLNGNLADGTYAVKYEMEDGSTVDIGNMTLGIGILDVTNLVATAKDYNGNILNGVGYAVDSKLNATVNTTYTAEMAIATATDGYTTVGVMSGLENTSVTLYVYGLDFIGKVGNKIATYSSSMQCRYTKESLTDGSSDDKLTVTKLADHYYKITLNFVSNIRNVALSGTTVSGLTPIVTNNEPILNI